jgi:dTDP-glucose 4,6-dehydratase
LLVITSEGCGDLLAYTKTEEFWGNVNQVSLRCVYDEAKRYIESINMAHHTFHLVETRIIRIFNTYGPRIRLNNVRALPTFIGQGLRDEDMMVFGDGSQTWSL